MVRDNRLIARIERLEAEVFGEDVPDHPMGELRNTKLEHDRPLRLQQGTPGKVTAAQVLEARGEDPSKLDDEDLTDDELESRRAVKDDEGEQAAANKAVEKPVDRKSDADSETAKAEARRKADALLGKEANKNG